MTLLELLIIGLALSMDAFAVTVANTCGANGTKRTTVAQRLDSAALSSTATGSRGAYATLRLLAMPIVFGACQGIMPLVGYFAGSFAATLIDSYAGIIALVILACIGGKMVWDGARSLVSGGSGSKGEQDEPGGAGDAGDTQPADARSTSPAPTLTFPTILAQGIATSIDALIIGVSLLALGANIWLAASLIAATTFVCCLLALAIGRRFGVLLGDKAQIVGGAVLVLIGIKACFF
jgi:putative Mn2+ efflux pump MntP